MHVIYNCKGPKVNVIVPRAIVMIIPLELGNYCHPHRYAKVHVLAMILRIHSEFDVTYYNFLVCCCASIDPKVYTWLGYM